MAMTKLEKMWADTQNLATAYAKSVNEGKPEKVQKAAKKMASEMLAEYNLEWCRNRYREWDNTPEGAVKTAIIKRYVVDTKSVKYPVGEDGFIYPEFTSTRTKANLPDMERTLGKDRFANPRWFDMLEKLAFLYATKLSRRINGDAHFEYKISDAAKEFNFTDGKFYSDAHFYEALQQVIDAILVIPDEDGNNLIKAHLEEDDNGIPYSREWEVVTESLTRQGNELGVVIIGATGKMSELIADVMHVIIDSDLDFKLTL